MRGLDELKKSVRILYEAKQDFDSVKEHYEQVRKKETLKISNWFFVNCKPDQKSIEVELDEGKQFYANHTKIIVTKKQNKKIVWDMHMLKQTFAKHILKQIIDKTYTVTDMDGLVGLMKKHHVPPNEFKKFFSVSETVNETKLTQLNDIGVIKDSSLEGCYTLVKGESYITVTPSRKK